MVSITIDSMTGKKMLDADYGRWLFMNQASTITWMHNNLNPASWSDFLQLVSRNKFVGYLLMKQYRMSMERKEQDLIDKLKGKRGRIDLIIGSKGSGKTSLAFYLAHKLWEQGERIWWFGPSTELPWFIEGSSHDFNSIPVNTTTIVDEASVQFFSRVPGEKTNVIRILPIVRHSGRNFIFVTQSTAISDIQFVRLADSLIYKTFAVLQSQTERVKIADELKLFIPNKISEYLYYDDEEILTLEYNLPRWWKSVYSTPYAPFNTAAELYRFIFRSMEFTDNEIITQIGMKGKDVTPIEMSYYRMLFESHGQILFELEDEELENLVQEGFDHTSLNELVENKRSTDKCTFELTDIEKAEFHTQFVRRPEELILSQRKVNNILDSEMETRIRKGRNIIISIHGGTGTGKSLSSISVAEVIAKKSKKAINVDNIVFSVSELLSRLPELKRNDVVILDEQIQTWGVGSGRQMEELRNAEETLRKNQIHFIFNSPELRPHLHHFVLQTYGIDYALGKARLLLYTPKKSLLGYIILRKPKTRITAKYEKKKDQFLKQVQERTTAGKSYLEDLAKKIVDDPAYSLCKNRLQRITFIERKQPNLTTAESERIIALVEILSREQ